MRVLIADDDPISRRLLEVSLKQWKHDVIVTCDGTQAWQTLQQPDFAPPLLILDWLMPGLDGVELCQRVRETPALEMCYIILLTQRGTRQDMVEGLEAGADDYLTKPFDPDELRARIQVGARVVKLQGALADRVRQLEDALQRVNQLQGLLPICSYCKRIRDDGNYWHQVEAYIEHRSEAQFSHGICPQCVEKFKQQFASETAANNG
jgi:DNA-binding response OmpR family regulator